MTTDTGNRATSDHNTDNESQDDVAPRDIRNRYQLQELIAAGGMAEVYRAHDDFLGRDVAVKVFRASATAEADFRRQEDEVNVLARLNHPNLVTLLDAAVDRSDAENPQIYYVMELVPGTDLKRRLDDGPLVPRQVAQLGYYAASGLEYVHSRGIVHRDVKPANILLTFNDDKQRVTAKLGDFGIASVGHAAAIADDEIVTGTVAYLSPEQAKGETVGFASDVYSLGLVLLQCFTGVLAFPGPPQASAMARLIDDPEVPDSVPEEWRPLLRAMTSRHPADRPDIHDVALALRGMFMAETGRHKATVSAPVPVNEADRMRALRQLDLLDSPPDPTFDRITAMAARVTGTPVSIISVVDADRIWFASHHGLDVDQIGRDAGLCGSAIMQSDPWIIEDARSDERAAENPLVSGDFGLQFYAGVPLVTREGYPLGTLCVLDFEPRTISSEELATLKDLAAMVMRELELRREANSMLGAAGESAWLQTVPPTPDGSLVTNRPEGTKPETGPVELAYEV